MEYFFKNGLVFIFSKKSAIMKSLMNVERLCKHLVFVLLAVTLASCAGPYRIYQKDVATEVKDYYNYLQGSFWVYEDSLGNVDSTWITSYTDIKWAFNPSNENDFVQKIEYYINSSSNQKIYAKIQPDIDQDYTACDWVTQSPSGASLFSWSVIHNSQGFQSTDGKIVEFQNLLRVGVVDYSNVYLIKRDNLPTSDEICIAKNVGIIRKKIANVTYNLVRKQVYQ